MFFTQKVFFCRATVCRPFCIFERCLDVRRKQVRYQLSHPSPITHLTKKVASKLSEYGLGIQDPEKTEPGSRSQKGTGSRIRNTAVPQCCDDVACTLSLCVRRWWASTLTANVISWPSSLSWNQCSGSMTIWCGSGSGFGIRILLFLSLTFKTPTKN